MFRVRPPAIRPENPAEANAALFSTRTFMIVVLSMTAALIIGLGAGLTAGLVAHDAGPAAATAIGCVVGLAAAITGGLTVISVLNQLVANKSD
ncbi:hypothetical protein [Nonomuraea guangzhouensis]|uniref:DUF4190 domain-containing protein n=1 Tax=Nonomuraea guangzhouensis TaxID=1291555 RepID=A0ABW4GBY6_9ACTN|nr:hypothetical protein [Nonomuraea guangzhouensis]